MGHLKSYHTQRVDKVKKSKKRLWQKVRCPN